MQPTYDLLIVFLTIYCNFNENKKVTTTDHLICKECPIKIKLIKIAFTLLLFRLFRCALPGILFCTAHKFPHRERGLIPVSLILFRGDPFALLIQLRSRYLFLLLGSQKYADCIDINKYIDDNDVIR